MKTLPPLKTRDPEWDSQHDETHDELPGRPRRQILNWWTALLMALILGAVGFYVGIRVEKGQSGGSSATARGFSFPGAGAAAGAGAGAGASGGSALRAAFSGGAGGTFGTVSSISGNTLYVTDASGNTVKVQLSSATQVSKSVNVSKKSLRPGDTVVIGGLTNKKGTVVATSVRDSGASGGTGTASGSSSGSGSGGGSATSGSAAVRSLFGSGG